MLALGCYLPIFEYSKQRECYRMLVCPVHLFFIYFIASFKEKEFIFLHLQSGTVSEQFEYQNGIW